MSVRKEYSAFDDGHVCELGHETRGFGRKGVVRETWQPHRQEENQGRLFPRKPLQK